MITEKEAIELSFLLQKRDRGRMRRTNYERMRELTEKMNHNACLNASCSGYQGTEMEIICPKCEHKLYKRTKSIDQVELKQTKNGFRKA